MDEVDVQQYEAAPLLVNNLGQSDVVGVLDEINGVQRNTWEARFASAFRSRKSALPGPLAKSIEAAWRVATKVAAARATIYWQALPRKPDVIDADRAATFARLRRLALGATPDAT